VRYIDRQAVNRSFAEDVAVLLAGGTERDSVGAAIQIANAVILDVGAVENETKAGAFVRVARQVKARRIFEFGEVNACGSRTRESGHRHRDIMLLHVSPQRHRAHRGSL